MQTHYSIIKSLLTTEKSTSIYGPQGKYLFLVEKSANKIEVKRAIESIHNVKVKSVNSFISRGKLKRVRQQIGKTPDLKKVIVTLQPGQKIEVA